jgi:hypothetical protein
MINFFFFCQNVTIQTPFFSFFFFYNFLSHLLAFKDYNEREKKVDDRNVKPKIIESKYA